MVGNIELLISFYLICCVSGKAGVWALPGLGGWRWAPAGSRRDSSSPRDHVPLASPSAQTPPPTQLSSPSPSSPRPSRSARARPGTPTPSHLLALTQRRLHAGLHGGFAWPLVHDLAVFLGLVLIYILVVYRQPPPSPPPPGLPESPAATRHRLRARLFQPTPGNWHSRTRRIPTLYELGLHSRDSYGPAPGPGP